MNPTSYVLEIQFSQETKKKNNTILVLQFVILLIWNSGSLFRLAVLLVNIFFF